MPKTALLKKKKSFAELMRDYGLPPSITSKKHLRYRQPVEKGICWYWFAHYIRARDVKKWGTCISCNKKVTFAMVDAGHYGAAANCGIDLLMDEVNVNAECSACNAWDDGHLVGYERGLRERYGDAITDLLKAAYLEAKWKASSKSALTPEEWGMKALRYKTLYETESKT